MKDIFILYINVNSYECDIWQNTMENFSSGSLTTILICFMQTVWETYLLGEKIRLFLLFGYRLSDHLSAKIFIYPVFTY